MAIWTATNVSLPSNSRIVTVNTGDDVGQMYTGFIIQINDLQFKTVRTVNTGASPQTIELDELYTGASISGGSAIGAPTQGAIKEAAEELRQLRTTYEGLANSVSESGTANSLVRRTAQGRVKAADGVAVDDCVTMSQIGTAAARDVGIDSGNVMEVGAFGIGAKLTPAFLPTSDIDDATSPAGLYRIDNNVTGVKPPGATFGTLSVTRYNSTECSQFFISILGATYTRFHRNTDGWTDWLENYHSGNTNFNEFVGEGLSDLICPTLGWAETGTQIVFLLPINSTTPPSSISVTGTLRFYNVDAGVYEDAVNPPTLATNIVSSRVAYISFTGLSGKVRGAKYVLVNGASSAAKITVNF